MDSGVSGRLEKTPAMMRSRPRAVGTTAGVSRSERDIKALVDTNILVYRFDTRFPRKQAIATDLLRRGLREDSVRIPHQAIVEFIAAVTPSSERGRLAAARGGCSAGGRGTARPVHDPLSDRVAGTQRDPRLGDVSPAMVRCSPLGLRARVRSIGHLLRGLPARPPLRHGPADQPVRLKAFGL